MEEWSCIPHGFVADELAFIQRVFDAKDGWRSQGKQAVLNSKAKKLFSLTKTPDAVMQMLFPQTHLRGLSVTDSRKWPAAVYIHAGNWSKIPAGSEYTDLQEYRAALVNHELAHVFGHGHVTCPCTGCLSDVRQQPSKPLQGCLPHSSVKVYANQSEDMH